MLLRVEGVVERQVPVEEKSMSAAEAIETQEGPNTADNTTPMIEVSGLHKLYGSVEALRGISFTVGRGEIVGLLGPNGAERPRP